MSDMGIPGCVANTSPADPPRQHEVFNSSTQLCTSTWRIQHTCFEGCYSQVRINTYSQGLSNRWDEEEFLTWRDKGDHYLKKYSNYVFQKTKRKDRKGSQWKDIFFMFETIGTSKFMRDFSNPWINLNKGN